MSTFTVKGQDVDVEAIMATIRKRIEEKRKGLYTESEIREIAEMKLDSVLDASEFNSDFVTAFRAREVCLARHPDCGEGKEREHSQGRPRWDHLHANSRKAQIKPYTWWHRYSREG